MRNIALVFLLAISWGLNFSFADTITLVQANGKAVPDYFTRLINLQKDLKEKKVSEVELDFGPGGKVKVDSFLGSGNTTFVFGIVGNSTEVLRVPQGRSDNIILPYLNIHGSYIDGIQNAADLGTPTIAVKESNPYFHIVERISPTLSMKQAIDLIFDRNLEGELAKGKESKLMGVRILAEKGENTMDGVRKLREKLLRFAEKTAAIQVTYAPSLRSKNPEIESYGIGDFRGGRQALLDEKSGEFILADATNQIPCSDYTQPPPQDTIKTSLFSETALAWTETVDPSAFFLETKALVKERIEAVRNKTFQDILKIKSSGDTVGYAVELLKHDAANLEALKLFRDNNELFMGDSRFLKLAETYFTPRKIFRLQDLISRGLPAEYVKSHITQINPERIAMSGEDQVMKYIQIYDQLHMDTSEIRFAMRNRIKGCSHWYCEEIINRMANDNRPEIKEGLKDYLISYREHGFPGQERALEAVSKKYEAADKEFWFIFLNSGYTSTESLARSNSADTKRLNPSSAGNATLAALERMHWPTDLSLFLSEQLKVAGSKSFLGTYLSGLAAESGVDPKRYTESQYAQLGDESKTRILDMVVAGVQREGGSGDVLLWQLIALNRNFDKPNYQTGLRRILSQLEEGKFTEKSIPTTLMDITKAAKKALASPELAESGYCK